MTSSCLAYRYITVKLDMPQQQQEEENDQVSWDNRVQSSEGSLVGLRCTTLHHITRLQLHTTLLELPGHLALPRVQQQWPELGQRRLSKVALHGTTAQELTVFF